MQLFTLSDAHVLKVTGRHAERYLQARLSNDIRLASGKYAIAAAALTPQGKVELYCSVLRTNSNDFLLIVDGGVVTDIQSALLRFRVTEQVEVAVEESSKLFHINASPAELQIAAEAQEGSVVATEFGFAIARNRCGRLGTDIVLASGKEAVFSAWLKKHAVVDGSEKEFHEQRLRSKLPMFPFEINSNVILLEAGVEHAVSFTKGCYAGQEVIARIDSQGRPPRKLAFFRLVGALAPVVGESIFRMDDLERKRSVGSVAFVTTSTEGGYVCSAYVKNDPDILQGGLRLVSGQLQGLE